MRRDLIISLEGLNFLSHNCRREGRERGRERGKEKEGESGKEGEGVIYGIQYST